MHRVKTATLETANLELLTIVRPKSPFLFRSNIETETENWP